MIKRISYYVSSILLPACLFMACQSPAISRAQAPVINSVTPAGTSVAKYDMFGLAVNLTAGYTNPYDYNDIAVRCVFTSPSGRKDTVDGFYMQDYTLSTSSGNITATGTGAFKVRYTPNETGAWQYVVSCTNTLGTATQPPQTFQCTASSAAGFIRKNSTNYLGFDDATQYIPVGENMCWQDNNVYTDYTKWINKLADNNGNYIRLWMPSWGLGIEWKNGNGYAGLEKYNQGNAFYLDWLLGFCRQKGVYMMLCLDHHGQVSSTTDANWSDNPYNAVNGGPCANTWDFFTNATARSLIKNRFRYIMARYGYSSNIMCWELFNEVDWTDNFTAHQQDVSGWHAEMASYLKAIDVYKHLVTTSYAHDNYDFTTWNLPNIDFTQTHYYNSSPNLESVLANGCQNYLSAYNKPTLNGEFGINASASALNTTDPTGVYIHNSIWATAFGGGMGPAMSWWWDTYIETQNLYTHFKPLGQLLTTLPLKDGNYKKTSASVNSASSAAAYVLAAADSSKAAGWVLNNQYNWQYLQTSNGVPPPAITNARLNISSLRNGTWQVQFFDCATGAVTSTVSAVASNNILSVAMPAVAHDIAIVATFTSITAVVNLPAARQLLIYPNPVVNSDLFITYDLKARSPVSMVLYDLAGRRITTVFNGTQNIGQQTVRFDPSHRVQAAGLYLLAVQVGNDRHTEKLLFTR